MKLLLLLTLIFLTFTTARAQKIEMPQFFADGMVLQREARVPVWGKGQAGQHIDIRIVNNNQEKATVIAKTKAKIATDGTWKAYLPKMKAGGPYTMILTVAPSGINKYKISPSSKII